MKRMLIIGGAALAFASTAAMAQSAPATCYVHLGKLMADAPEGVGELGAAIRQLDTALRPQVEQIKLLEAELDRLQLRQREAMQTAAPQGAASVQNVALQPEGGSSSDLAELQDETQRVREQLVARRQQLHRDYAAQRSVLLAPVQARVNARAQVFASRHGCGQMKMARTTDLAALQAAAARDVTGEFVTWYAQNKS